MNQIGPVAAYILHRRVYKESSLILDVFTPEYGRLSVIANGALKSKKGWSAMLQVFQPLLITWSGRSSLKTLVSADAPSSAIPLQGYSLFSAYYLNELLLKLLPQEEAQSSSTNNMAIFLAYAEALNSLLVSENIEIPLRLFEYQLLSELGVFPDITADVNGDEIESSKFYSYVSQAGFICVDMNKPLNENYNKGLYLSGCDLFKFSDLHEISVEDGTFLKKAKSLMRALINELLGGTELKSRTLFKSYQPYSG